MSVEAVWCLFRIEPEDFAEIQQVFEDAVAQSESVGHRQKYLERRERHAHLLKQRLSAFPFYCLKGDILQILETAETAADGVGTAETPEQRRKS
ncbi:hypothetical protein IQ241_16435 [Romeria aff. gracilis LEGE 07310]|uniref:Uncharacterized protein n=1 Tax=Vasconcelosia minhoensis LEGE 07310 TaxID=915328 RepID=A0A8J7DMI6_9CYAN|nr:hypothetical protein [Romeria gracilis]MBE9078861.1 hypothetical protein [Romeria aff. gracilis LEGE 07310]